MKYVKFFFIFLIVFLAIVSKITFAVPNGLVAAYSFNEGIGTTVADSSGNSNTGTISGATWAVGKYGNALSFDGVNDLVTINDANSLDLTNKMTLEAWVYPASISSDWRTVILKERPGSLSYALYATDGASRPPVVYVNIGGVDRAAVGTSTLPLNTWTHLAGTYYGSALRLYVNGVLVKTTTISGSITTSSSPLRIGGNNVWGEWFSGKIDEVRIYNKTLTQLEIQNDMNTPIGAQQSLPIIVNFSASPMSIISGQNSTLTWSTINATSVSITGLGTVPTSGSSIVSPTTTTTYTLTATNSGGSVTKNVTINVTQVPDTTPPIVFIISPLNNSTVSGIINVNVTATDNVGVSYVELYKDNVFFGNDTIAPYIFAWNTSNDANGLHTLQARAIDTSGNTAFAANVTVTVFNPPKLVIISPVNNTLIINTTVNVSYTTSGNLTGVDHVHFRLDSNPEVMDMTFDGFYQFTTVPAGSHILNGYLAKSDHSKINGSDATPVSFTTVVPDTIPPNVFITSPANGSTVSGTITISANASDNVGIVGVQFKVDGANLETEDTTAPYSIAWNSATVANGAHTLSAVARDAAGNLANSTITIPVSNVNLSAPSFKGQWSAPFFVPIVAVHMALLPTGKVLMWSGPPSDGGQTAQVWDPATGIITPVSNSQTDLFCAGHAMLADGKILTIGGDSKTVGLGVQDVNAFDPFTQNWTSKTPMAFKRWYPTGTILADGRVFVTSGADDCETCVISTPEIFNPNNNTWVQLLNANLSIPLYPFQFLLPDGDVLVAGSYEFSIITRKLDIETQTWTVVDPVAVDGGSAVMYLSGKVMKSGKSANANPPIVPSLNTTYVLDMTEPIQAWQQTASMAFPRAYHVMTLLPDSTVLVTGGGRNTDATDNANAVLEAEIWSLATKTWSTMAAMQIPRLYHGTAILLQDGRVLVAGSGAFIGTNQLSAEIYSPPYLFKGVRPNITSSPNTILYGSTFFVGTPNSANISKVSLLRVGTITHSFNPDQRLLNLSFQDVGNGLNVEMPLNPNVTPPGYYMLFIINNNGVPSIASFVRVPSTSEDSQPPTAPTNLTAIGAIGVASLSWTASTDNVGIANYNIYRSTLSGFTPNTSNLIAQTTLTNYTDIGLAAGTYYYRVTAQDLAGNIGQPSNEASAIVSSDTIPPTVPTNLTATSVSSSQINLAWMGSTDNVGVIGYKIYRSGLNIANSTTTSFSNTGLSPNTTYTYTVSAFDAAGLESAQSIPASATTPLATQPTGLVAAYSINEGTGTTANDASGNSNNGVISGATWTIGKYGNALSFNGINDQVSVPNNAGLQLSTMTISAWINIKSAPTHRHIIGKNFYELSADPSGSGFTTSFEFRSGGIWFDASSGVLPFNQWHHVAATYNGNVAIRLYVNGVLVASVNNAAGLIDQTIVPFRIGTADASGDFVNGIIDEVRVYNRVLTQAEIQNDMNSPI